MSIRYQDPILHEYRSALKLRLFHEIHNAFMHVIAKNEYDSNTKCGRNFGKQFMTPGIQNALEDDKFIIVT